LFAIINASLLQILKNAVCGLLLFIRDGFLYPGLLFFKSLREAAAVVTRIVCGIFFSIHWQLLVILIIFDKVFHGICFFSYYNIKGTGAVLFGLKSKKESSYSQIIIKMC